MGSPAYLAVAALTLVGCNGLISTPGAGGDASEGDGWSDAPPISVPGAGHIAAMDGVRRLTNVEHANSMQSLFGAITHRSALAPDTRVHGYDRIAEGMTVSPQHIEGYGQTALNVANAIIADETALTRWLPCAVDDLPSRIRPRTTVQLGGDLVCSYSSNCYRPSDNVSYPNVRPGGAAPGRIHYEESVPAAGRYRMTVRAHMGGTVGDAVLEVRHGEFGVLGTFSPDGDTYADYDIAFDVPSAGTLPLTIEWRSPLISPQRRVYIDTITLTGPIGTDDGSPTLTRAEERACMDSMIGALGPRVYRRPLDPEEHALLSTVFDAGAVDGFWDGVRMVLEVLLQSPHFLYVIEVGSPAPGLPGYHRLNAYELATRLSFLAWQAPPDDQLWDAAQSGDLDTESGIEREAARLFADPRAIATIRRFYEQWLELDELLHVERAPSLFPEFTPALREAMLEETRRFLDGAIWEDGAGLDDILTAGHSFLDDDLAALYGVDEPESPFDRVELPAERVGLLTRSALLTARSQANQTSPVLRGVFVLEQFLCIDLPAPPDDIDVNPPALEAEGAPTPRTTRERWAQHSSDPSCRGCHREIDPVGFTFEAFDPVGRFRTEEQGRIVDTAGGIPSIGIDDGTVADAAELGYTLAAAPEARDCFARQWMRFGLGRLERDTDAGDIGALVGALDDGGIENMLLALINTAAFRHRIVEEELAAETSPEESR